MKKLVIITGLSGSGKSLAATTFEDVGFYVSDNIPPQTFSDTAKIISKLDKYEGFAAVIDWRSLNNFYDLVKIYEDIKTSPIEGYEKPNLLFFNCQKNELIRRFKETKRKHPLANEGNSVTSAIDLEKEMYAPVLDKADLIYDTTYLKPEELRQKIRSQFSDIVENTKINITVSSFGFKYGMPIDPDLVFDVRFLKNPYWEPSLRNFTGRDKAVKDYIFSDEKTITYMNKLYDLLDFSIPEYEKNGKAYLNIAIGCTGGKHRSIAIAEALTEHLKELGYIVRFESRDN